MSKDIPKDEMDVYDRQIRLWGIDAQKRIRTSHVLLIHIRELAEEIAKNLILAGVGTLTLLDGERIKDIDSKPHFCIKPSDIGKTYADAASCVLKELNPSVTLQINETPIEDVLEDYFSAFDVIIANELGLDLMIRLNTICRMHKKPFYSCAIYGFYGYIFADLIEHTYSIEKKIPNCPEKSKRIEYTEHYYPLSEVINHTFGLTLTERDKKKVSPLLPAILGLLKFQRQYSHFPSNSDEITQYLSLIKEEKSRLVLSSDDILDNSTLINLAKNAKFKWSPVASVIGSILAQDVLNVLSKQEKPIQNWFFFDGEKCAGPIYHV